MIVRILKQKLEYKTALAFALAILVVSSSFSVASFAITIDELNNIGKGSEPFADWVVYENESDWSDAVEESEKGNPSEPEGLPARYNAAELGYVTPVKNQGKSYCCWSFSSISALESDAIMKGWETKDSVDFSEAHLTWFIYTANSDETDQIYDESVNYSGPTPYGVTGNAGRVVAALARGTGLADEEKYPFNPNDLQGMGYYPNTAYYDNNGYAVKNTAELKDAEAIKKWITKHGSCIANIYSSSQYFYSSANGYTYYCPTKSAVNHSITIVGWDDEFSADMFSAEPEGKGAWICKNSYGTEWGDNGYFYLSYFDPSASGFTGFEICKADYSNTYTYNANPHSALLHSEKDISSANIFHIKKSEKIEYVSFYTFAENEYVTFELYQLTSGTGGPCNGYLLKTEWVIFCRPGYHKVRVFDDMQLYPNTFYSVVVSTHAEGTVYVPVEVSSSKTYKYNKSANQSFYSMDGKKWADSSKYGNVYINIYTSDADICSHKFTDVGTEPTCTQEGLSKMVCSECGYVKSCEKLAALGHSTKTIETDGTCLECGKITTYCERCSQVLTEESNERTGEHQFTKVSVNPTCTENGYTKEVCKLCGSTGLITVTKATGHKYTTRKVKAENGNGYIMVEECTVCGSKGKTVNVLTENMQENPVNQNADGEKSTENETQNPAEKEGFFNRLIKALKMMMNIIFG